jgi:hypothetical protein
MDLLTVLAHELGHVIGHEHEDDRHDLMSSTLDAGVRLLPDNNGRERFACFPDDRTPSGNQQPMYGPWSSVFEDLGDADPAVGFLRPLSSALNRHQPLDNQMTDSLFAGLDDEFGDVTGRSPEPIEGLNNNDATKESEDGPDLWSLM